jgi:ABC-type nitrate/sulfonate/bicarbonate transport system ATPase subunit
MTTSHNTDLIVIDGVSHTFDTNSGQLQVLDKLTLGVPENGFSAIVGPSGCGKSTVTRLVAGLLKPDEGRHGLSEPGAPRMAQHPQECDAAT